MMFMDKNEKEILKHLVKRELEILKDDEKKVSFGFASPAFIKTLDEYEHVLKNLLKKLE